MLLLTSDIWNAFYCQKVSANHTNAPHPEHNAKIASAETIARVLGEASDESEIEDTKTV